MGFFDMFLSEDKLIAKRARTVTDRDAQPEEREEAVHFLANKGTERAILGILSRFDISLDNGLKDTSEKEYTFDVLCSLGTRAVGPTEGFLKRCKQIAWPLRLYGALTNRDKMVDMAFELLDRERQRDDFKPAKKKALLVWLSEHRDARSIEAAAPFLGDFDEGVRYAALEVIAGQHDPAGREPLLGALCSADEDSNRVRLRIAEIFAQRGWSVAGGDPAILGGLQGFTVNADRLVAS